MKNTQKGNAAVIIVVVIAVALGAYFLTSRNNNEVSVSPTPTPTPTATVVPTTSTTVSPSPSVSTSPKTSPSPTAVSSVKSFTVVGSPFKFVPGEIKVKKGDTVKITFKNSSGTHDWSLDEFNVKTNVLQGGQEQTVQFVANKTGSFEYYCSVGSHRQMGMKGTLIVE